MDEAIKFLEEAIKYAGVNEPDIAARNTEEAIKHIRDSCR